MNKYSYICVAMKTEEEIEKMDEAAYLLKAISHGTRLRVINTLHNQGEMSVSELIKELECEQSLLSHHLTDMRAKGILSCRKEGKNCFYSLKNKQVCEILDCLTRAVKLKKKC